MKKKMIVLTALVCIGFSFLGCGTATNQDKIDKIFLDGDLRVFYPAEWYVEKGTISNASLQQDLLVALGDVDAWKRSTKDAYEKATSKTTAQWYQFGSTTVNGAILLQPYGNEDYIRMDYDDKQYYFVAKEKPSLKLIPLIEKNKGQIVYDLVK